MIASISFPVSPFLTAVQNALLNWFDSEVGVIATVVIGVGALLWILSLILHTIGINAELDLASLAERETEDFELLRHDDEGRTYREALDEGDEWELE